MRTIYVIVHVAYDWHRFQTNLAATTDIKQARRLAKKHAKELRTGSITEDAKQSQNLDGIDHVWIENFIVP